MSDEQPPPGEGGAPAAPRVLRGWGTVLVILLLLGWCGARQPFYQPAIALAAVIVLALAIHWSWRVSLRRGERRRRRSRRRDDRRGE